jgi:hypothetical protein
MSDLRQANISPYVSNALPRNWSSANIVVPLQLQDLTVAFALPYYIGVRQQEELAAASPSHKIIPWRGFVLRGAKVLKDFQLCEDLPFLRGYCLLCSSTNTEKGCTASPTSYYKSKG